MKQLSPNLLSVIALCLTLCACASGPTPAPTSAPAAEPTAMLVAADAVAPGTAPDSAADALFFQTIPAAGGNQMLQVGIDERASISIASMQGDVPEAIWTNAGWQIGAELKATEEVPQDCVLHPRQGIAHQLYAQCPGGATLMIPNNGADFIYVVLHDAQRAATRILQVGSLYNPDTTGLIH